MVGIKSFPADLLYPVTTIGKVISYRSHTSAQYLLLGLVLMLYPGVSITSEQNVTKIFRDFHRTMNEIISLMDQLIDQTDVAQRDVKQQSLDTFNNKIGKEGQNFYTVPQAMKFCHTLSFSLLDYFPKVEEDLERAITKGCDYDKSLASKRSSGSRITRNQLKSVVSDLVNSLN